MLNDPADVIASVKQAGVGVAQREDPIWSAAIKRLADGKPSKNDRDIVLENGLLYHISGAVKNDPQPRLQLVVPEVLIPVVLQANHDQSGHLGIDKTYNKIRVRFFWPNVQRCSKPS